MCGDNRKAFNRNCIQGEKKGTSIIYACLLLLLLGLKFMAALPTGSHFRARCQS